MKILLCAEFFYPSVGGVQEVVKQLATRLVLRGHDVTVATTHLAERASQDYQGIKIAAFEVTGNQVRGISGEADRYRQFIVESDFDAIFIYAAQQWTLDCILNVLPLISARKILVPCGFSGFYLPEYQSYFQQLALALKSFDALIFHARKYRDYDFAVGLGLTNCYLIPNGADGKEFGTLPSGHHYRSKMGILENAFVLLTVGTMNGAKGHLEVAEATALIETDREVVLILNGNQMPTHPRKLGSLFSSLSKISIRRILPLLKNFVVRGLVKMGLRESYLSRLNAIVKEINRGSYGRKRIIVTDLPRAELVQCFFEADLFVFASTIEYSPLVLFEASAAGLPFLSAPVGNADEIARWTGGGRICTGAVDSRGYTHVDPKTLASEIQKLIADESARDMMGRQGRESWQQYFDWDVLVKDYEAILSGSTITPKAFEGNRFE